MQDESLTPKTADDRINHWRLPRQPCKKKEWQREPENAPMPVDSLKSYQSNG
jgi:hypothetical protein